MQAGSIRKVLAVLPAPPAARALLEEALRTSRELPPSRPRLHSPLQLDSGSSLGRAPVLDGGRDAARDREQSLKAIPPLATPAHEDQKRGGAQLRRRAGRPK